MRRSFGISTTDNPYSPLTDFDRWLQFDTANGYNTCSYLARIAQTSEDLPDELNDIEIENAIDEIVEKGFAISPNGDVVHYIKV